MIVLDYIDIKKLQAHTRRPKRMRPVKPPALAERELKQRLEELWRRVLQPASQTIMQMVKDKATPQQIADYIDVVLREAEDIYGFAANDIVWRWKADVDNITRAAMQKSLTASLGVDVRAMLDTPAIADALAIGGQEMADLIKTIPGNLLGQVASAVSKNFRGEELPEGRSLLQQIQFLGGPGYSSRHARLVARDQTGKLSSLLQMTRQQSIGCDEYWWQTVQDNRVVGLPGGKYPNPTKLHGNHYKMQGLLCKWSDPLVFSSDDGRTWQKRYDGMPKTSVGIDIQCRCFPRVKLDINAIIAHARAG